MRPEAPKTGAAYARLLLEMGENDGTTTTTQVRQRPVCLSGQAESKLPIDFCSPVMTLLRVFLCERALAP